ncbi:hypothetical protein H7849_15495 [Alloacidobacterium dinghuense]|uniref:Uncharacterized protein n=1 Tax=Alloacidobacterium dinghuense TaxID=2763107 RepID=A0A7G8BDC4_9BACT|nr:hypothetical protein [Alloacidobacterium dinghuense]QNI30544.1 hypothetical protein H7849_15495 [Alloacidobacterium dinghuense]
MAFTETFRCEVCGKAKSGESEDWWLAWAEQFSPTPDAQPLPQLRFTPWDVLLSHQPDVRHLCGARCAQTVMDRWMTSSNGV